LFRIIRKHIIDSIEQQIHHNPELIDRKEGVVRTILRDDISLLAPATDVKLLINGEEKFDELLKALEEAKDHIHIQYYIFVDDEIGNRVKDILIRKAEEGVTVRFMVDDFGSHGLHRRMLKELERSKVEVAIFYKIRLYALANRLNYLNHRKIVIIDGHVGFVGGINVEDKYINNGKFKLFLRDTHLMVKGGAAVSKLQSTFISDWNFCSENKIELDLSYFSTEMGKDHKHLVQIVSSEPDSSRPTIMLSCLGVIMAS
jgi:cardiolipin synthase